MKKESLQNSNLNLYYKFYNNKQIGKYFVINKK